MYKNNEGYPDPTAFNAIQNQGAKAIWKDGMVIKIPNWTDTESWRVLIKVHNTFATTIEVYKEKRGENVPIKVNGTTMYIDPGKIGYTKMQTLNISTELCMLSDDEYLSLLKTVAADMGIKVDADFDEQWSVLTRYQNENERLREKIERLELDVVRVTKELDEAKAKDISGQGLGAALPDAGMDAVIAERDLYKRMYDGLIEKLITKISA